MVVGVREFFLDEGAGFEASRLVPAKVTAMQEVSVGVVLQGIGGALGVLVEGVGGGGDEATAVGDAGENAGEDEIGGNGEGVAHVVAVRGIIISDALYGIVIKIIFHAKFPMIIQSNHEVMKCVP